MGSYISTLFFPEDELTFPAKKLRERNLAFEKEAGPILRKIGVQVTTGEQKELSFIPWALPSGWKTVDQSDLTYPDLVIIDDKNNARARIHGEKYGGKPTIEIFENDQIKPYEHPNGYIPFHYENVFAPPKYSYVKMYCNRFSDALSQCKFDAFPQYE
jgi:hypothetical protein